MEIVLPDKSEKNDKPTEIKESKALTLLLSKDNRVYWYAGIENPKVEVTNFGPKGVRKLLQQKVNSISGLVVMIKSDDDAIYKNFVDILDEMNINKVPTYAIVDITDKELELIKTAQNQPKK